VEHAKPVLDPAIAARLKRDAAGLVPAIVQQHDSGEVLMLAWMNDEALRLTLRSGRATYFSRSRGTLWVKGETSGHHQYVKSVALDCDGDTLLLLVDQVGAACHTGERTCFFTDLEAGTGLSPDVWSDAQSNDARSNDARSNDAQSNDDQNNQGDAQ
jgi:phosphoribosyl-AMP cyclohydrolase